MIGMTLCSGIGAPEMAAPWVDWRFASEIEPFPREVLRQRLGYRLPDDQNQGEPLLWGDMTEVSPELMRSRGIPLPDLIVAGTPCQAFSVAGARKGLADARGNLTLKFVEICHAIVAARPDGRLAILWENVPGVLSDTGNAFGCFLGGLIGALDAIPAPAGGTWPGEGMVEGPRARAAWAILDAQYFGVAQRRRRVFVVIDFGNCIDPAAILLEPDSLRGDPPTRGQAGAGVAALTANGVGTCGADDNQGQAGHLIPQAFGGGNTSGPIDAAACLTAKGQRIDFEVETFIAHTLRGEGFDASEDGTGRGTPLVPVSVAENQRGELRLSEISQQITCGGGKPGQGYPTVLAPIAFDCKGTEVHWTNDGTHPTLRSMGSSIGHQNAGGHAAVAFAIQERATCENPNAGPDGAGFKGDGTAYTLEARTVPQAVATPWAVRRLTPVECSRLQGFPDHHTRIAWRGRPAEECPDGPQYKALGNSMAVPCVKWILDRLRISWEQPQPLNAHRPR